MNIPEYLENLSDADLIEEAKTAVQDLKEAAANQRESEWHQACFAGVMVFTEELSKRGLKMSTFH